MPAIYETGATTHAANDAILSVINDGNGSMCGYSYQRRLGRAIDLDRWAFREMARNYSRYANKHFGSKRLTSAEWVEAGDLLYAYYLEHVDEL